MFNILSFQSSFLLIHDVFVDSPYSASAVVFHGVEISPLLSWGGEKHIEYCLYLKKLCFFHAVEIRKPTAVILSGHLLFT